MSTPMRATEKDWIDQASYKDMLHKLRFAPVGDPLFEGDSGVYFKQAISAKQKGLPWRKHEQISKAVGWENKKQREADRPEEGTVHPEV